MFIIVRTCKDLEDRPLRDKIDFPRHDELVGGNRCEEVRDLSRVSLSFYSPTVGNKRSVMLSTKKKKRFCELPLETRKLFRHYSPPDNLFLLNLCQNRIGTFNQEIDCLVL